MRSGIFGWSLPPRCSTLPGEEPDLPCVVCGKEIDDCICPECQECGGIGDPQCYIDHGLVKTQEQIDSLAAAEAQWEANAAAEAAFWDNYEKQVCEWAEADYDYTV
jgi:hypothetical protein